MSASNQKDKDLHHILGSWWKTSPACLSRVAGLFSGRGFNIESLTVAETIDPEISRITLVTSGNEQIMEQIIKQLRSS